MDSSVTLSTSSSPAEKPSDARHLKNATRHNNVLPHVLKELYEKAMDPKYITTVPGHSCILSTRTGSQDMPQLKLEMKEGKKIQILCSHAVALYQGKKATEWFEELSHLCGIRQCLVHTVWELPWDNVSRDGCHKYKYFDQCPHQPPCLPEPPYDQVKAAISSKQLAEATAVAEDPEKVKKRLQNKAYYARKTKKENEQKKQSKKRKAPVENEEKQSDENSNPNTSSSTSSSTSTSSSVRPKSIRSFFS